MIDEDGVRSLVGIPKTAQIYSVVKSIIELNSDEVINNTNNIIEEGKDVDNFLWEIIKYIKDILIYKASKNLEIYNEEEKKQIDELSNKVSKEKLLQLIYELSELASIIKWSSQKTLVFQAGMIKACMEPHIDQKDNIKKEPNSNNVGETFGRPQNRKQYKRRIK